MNELNAHTFSPFADWVFSFVNSSPHAWVQVLIACFIYWTFILIPMLYFLQTLERKLCANIQMRLGPNRVGPAGSLQGFADQLKMVFKAGIELEKGNVLTYIPTLVIAILFLSISALPIANQWQITGIEESIILICCALVTVKLFLFWSAYTSSAKMAEVTAYRIIFELVASVAPMIVSILTICLTSGTLNLSEIAAQQGGAPWRWNILHNPGNLISGLTFFISTLIWTSRGPFGLSHNKAEIFSGANENLSGVSYLQVKIIEKLASFFGLALFVTLFLGAGKTPFSLNYFGKLGSLFEYLFFSIKVVLIATTSFWIRWALPEMRFDQITNLVFKKVLPLSILGLIITMVWLTLFSGKGMFQLL